MYRKFITEEDHPENEWYKQARKQNVETLPDFINHIMNGYFHDYGTICHAISTCALAAAYAAENTSEAGGITGFQAGFVMWDFIRQWNYRDNKTGLRIVDFDKILYPQYLSDFGKTIPRRIWENLQKEAKELLNKENGCVHPDVLQHWKNIANGIVPFGFEITE